MSSLTIASRFCGPTHSGNGGYVCGAVAAYADGPVTVKLRQPPPLDAPMTVEQDDAGILRVSHDQTLIAEAAPATETRWPRTFPARSPWTKSARWSAGPATSRTRTTPDCFVCGTNRQEGDGLRIFPVR